MTGRSGVGLQPDPVLGFAPPLGAERTPQIGVALKHDPTDA
jgi:hypothetical protein